MVKNDVRLHNVLQVVFAKLVVGADDGEVEALEEARHILQSEVELVVSDGSCRVAHLVHQSGLHVALEERVIR